MSTTSILLLYHTEALFEHPVMPNNIEAIYTLLNLNWQKDNILMRNHHIKYGWECLGHFLFWDEYKKEVSGELFSWCWWGGIYDEVWYYFLGVDL